MRIISKFHDYYDSARAWRDDSLVYVRNTAKAIELRTAPRELLTALREPIALVTAMPSCEFAKGHVIAFCGELYPCWVTREGETFYDTQRMEKAFAGKPRSEDVFGVTYEDRIAILRKDLSKRQKRWYGHVELTHGTGARFLAECATTLKVGAEAFRYVKAPVFEIGMHSDRGMPYRTYRAITANPRLYDRNFATQVDPYTAFQELGMYLGNDLVDQMDPNIERSDDDIRDSKGMDKWSFRKMGKDSER